MLTGTDLARAQGLPLLDQQQAARPESTIRCVAVTPDCEWVLSAEGGSLTLLHAGDDVWSTPDTAITDTFKAENGTKNVPIGHRGVLPARMIVDPRVSHELAGGNHAYIPNDINTPQNEEKPEVRDLLYIAGGRDGLWVQLLDAAPGGPCPAWRIDDAGLPGSGIQGSERWCSDVGLLTLEGTRYLVAIFGKRGQSRLRLYPLDQVHALASAANPETGAELTAVLQINLNKHPLIGSAPSDPAFASVQYSRSVALALAVDQRSESFADVYVAMGSHGVARVALGLDPFGVPGGSVTWGPWFGDDSPYVSNAALTPAHMVPKALYGDVSFAPQNRFIPHTAPRHDRVERPPVVDVAVFRDDFQGATPQLFLAVDNLFWVSLDLSNPNDWGPAMPLHHHEGRVEERFTGPDDPATSKGVVERYAVRGVHPELPQALVVGEDRKSTLARSLQVVQHHPSGKSYLLVTCSSYGFHHDYQATLSEPLPYTMDYAYGGSWDRIPGRVVTLQYEIPSQWSTSTDHANNVFNWVEQGGHEIQVPAIQDLSLPGEHENQLLAVHSYRIHDPVLDEEKGGICLIVLPLDNVPGSGVQPGNGGYPVYVRRTENLRGRQSFTVTHSILEPNLLIPAGNDGVLQPHGFLEFVPGSGGTPDELERIVPAGAGTSFVRRGPTGQVVLDSAQFENSTDPDRQFLFCSGAVEDVDRDLNIPYSPLTTQEATNQRWLLMDLRVRDASGSIDPEVLDYTYFHWEPDGFHNIGRGNYTSATSSRFFDLMEGTTDEASGWLFGVTYRSAEGCHVLDRATVFNEHAQAGSHDLDIGLLSSVVSSSKRLVTHPEFNFLPRDGAQNVPAGPIIAARYWWDVDNQAQPPPLDTLNPLRFHEDAWEVFNNVPVLTRVKGPNGVAGNLDAWVLAVPCGQVAYDSEWDLFDSSVGGDPLFTPPAPWPAEAKKALVQFFPVVPDGSGGWDVETREMPSYDYPNTLAVVAECSPLPKFTSPDSGNAFRVRRAEIEVNGTTRSYVFIADFAGAMHAIDVTDILDFPEVAGVDSLLQATSLPIHTWQAPLTTLDVHPNPVHDIAVHHEPGVGTRLYIAVRRVGVVVVDFDPTSTSAFTTVEEIQVGDVAYGLELRELPGGGHDLLLTDYGGGIRVLGN